MDEELEHGNHFKRYKSGYYWLDKRRIGRIVVSQRMVHKYNLSAKFIGDFFDKNIFEVDFKHEYIARFSHIIQLNHSYGYSQSKGSRATTQTPHGKCFSKEFVAWLNNFPLDLLYEGHENAEVWAWCQEKN